MQLPGSFIQDMECLLGNEQTALFMQALESEQPVSIRLNTRKLFPENSESLWKKPHKLTPVPWCQTGFYLKERLTFTFDPLFHAGAYYVQEASSMFLEQAMRQYIHEPVRMLDLCAAPGGKSTLAREVLPKGSLLVANEVIPSRASILVENLQKWGHPDVLVTSALPSELGTLTHLFDVLLTDVPCSGEGMFRKDPVALSEWSPENIALCERRQQEILRDIWPALKPGGLLIYSTCTYNIREDECQIERISHELGAEVIPVDIRPEWGITGNLISENFPVYRFLPHCAQGEGFFMAVLRKKDEDTRSDLSSQTSKRKSKQERKEKKKNTSPVSSQVLQKSLSNWLSSPPDSWNFETNEEGFCHAIRNTYTPVVDYLRKKGIRILSSGIPMAQQKGKDLLPHPALALSQALNREAFPQAAFTYEQAITYLRRESITLPADTPRGYVLATYLGLPLGFVKNIGNRSNTLYPAEWRIRSSYLPEQIRILEQIIERT